MIISGRVSIKMAPVVRACTTRCSSPSGRSRWAPAARRWASSTTTRSCPADKFLPVDMHIPGCPPRPEALVYGILKLRAMVMAKPDQGWRSRYGGRGTEECREYELAVDPDRGRHATTSPARMGKDGYECLTRRPGAESPQDAARAATPSPCWRRSTSADKAAITSCAAGIPRRRLEAPALGKGFTFLASVHASTYYRKEPRSACTTSCSDMHEGGPHDGQGARPARRPARPVGPRRTGRRRQSVSAEVSTCRRDLPDGHPDLRRILIPEDYEGFPAAPRLPDGRRGRSSSRTTSDQTGWWKK
jgi:hypothetical protein